MTIPEYLEDLEGIELEEDNAVQFFNAKFVFNETMYSTSFSGGILIHKIKPQVEKKLIHLVFDALVAYRSKCGYVLISTKVLHSLISREFELHEFLGLDQRKKTITDPHKEAINELVYDLYGECSNYADGLLFQMYLFYRNLFSHEYFMKHIYPKYEELL